MSEQRILRVFPRRTRATPTDDLAWIGPPNLLAWTLEIDAVEVSVAFSWDVPQAERMAEAWRAVAPTTIGGPAMGSIGEAFVPGRYVKPGYVITSRGCLNKCWFCSVWRREGQTVRELPIVDGWNVLDDNLLACSPAHQAAVFAMLSRQPRRAEFTGGLEAARLTAWHVDALCDLNPQQMFFAYDTEDDYEPLRAAGQMLREAGLIRSTSHAARCYVLIGYPKDTFEDAERRLNQTIDAGFMPMAMLWHNERGERVQEWRQFQREWVRPMIVAQRMKQRAEEVPNV